MNPDALPALSALETAVELARRPSAAAEAVPVVPREHFLAALRGHRAKVRETLDSIITSDGSDRGLDALLASGALAAILPEVAALEGFGDGEWRHKDVWKHTKQVVRQSERTVEMRWAALLHDIGKVKTRSFTPDGRVHFFGHAELGARMFGRICKRTKLFPAGPQRRTIRFLILHHLRANQYVATWTDSAVRRFAREMGSELDNLLKLARADITTKRPEKKRRGLRQIDELAERIAALAAEDARVPPLPTGIGNHMMEAFGLPPSRRIGELKRALELAVEAGRLPGYQTADFYIDYMMQHRDEFELPVERNEDCVPKDTYVSS